MPSFSPSTHQKNSNNSNNCAETTSHTLDPIHPKEPSTTSIQKETSVTSISHVVAMDMDSGVVQVDAPTMVKRQQSSGGYSSGDSHHHDETTPGESATTARGGYSGSGGGGGDGGVVDCDSIQNDEEDAIVVAAVIGSEVLRVGEKDAELDVLGTQRESRESRNITTTTATSVLASMEDPSTNNNNNIINNKNSNSSTITTAMLTTRSILPSGFERASASLLEAVKFNDGDQSIATDLCGDNGVQSSVRTTKDESYESQSTTPSYNAAVTTVCNDANDDGDDDVDDAVDIDNTFSNRCDGTGIQCDDTDASEEAIHTLDVIVRASHGISPFSWCRPLIHQYVQYNKLANWPDRCPPCGRRGGVGGGDALTEKDAEPTCGRSCGVNSELPNWCAKAVSIWMPVMSTLGSTLLIPQGTTTATSTAGRSATLPQYSAPPVLPLLTLLDATLHGATFVTLLMHVCTCPRLPRSPTLNATAATAPSVAMETQQKPIHAVNSNGKSGLEGAEVNKALEHVHTSADTAVSPRSVSTSGEPPRMWRLELPSTVVPHVADGTCASEQSLTPPTVRTSGFSEGTSATPQRVRRYLGSNLEVPNTARSPRPNATPPESPLSKCSTTSRRSQVPSARGSHRGSSPPSHMGSVDLTNELKTARGQSAASQQQQLQKTIARIVASVTPTPSERSTSQLPFSHGAVSADSDDGRSSGVLPRQQTAVPVRCKSVSPSNAKEAAESVRLTAAGARPLTSRSDPALFSRSPPRTGLESGSNVSNYHHSEASPSAQRSRATRTLDAHLEKPSAMFIPTAAERSRSHLSDQTLDVNAIDDNISSSGVLFDPGEDGASNMTENDERFQNANSAYLQRQHSWKSWGDFPEDDTGGNAHDLWEYQSLRSDGYVAQETLTNSSRLSNSNLKAFIPRTPTSIPVDATDDPLEVTSSILSGSVSHRAKRTGDSPANTNIPDDRRHTRQPQSQARKRFASRLPKASSSSGKSKSDTTTRSRSAVTEQIRSLERRRQRQIMDTMALAQAGLAGESSQGTSTPTSAMYENRRGTSERSAPTPTAGNPRVGVPPGRAYTDQLATLLSRGKDKFPSGSLSSQLKAEWNPNPISELYTERGSISPSSWRAPYSQCPSPSDGFRTPYALKAATSPSAGRPLSSNRRRSTRQSKRHQNVDRRMDDVTVQHGETGKTFSVSLIYRDSTGGSKRTISTITLPTMKGVSGGASGNPSEVVSQSSRHSTPASRKSPVSCTSSVDGLRYRLPPGIPQPIPGTGRRSTKQRSRKQSERGGTSLLHSPAMSANGMESRNSVSPVSGTPHPGFSPAFLHTRPVALSPSLSVRSKSPSTLDVAPPDPLTLHRAMVDPPANEQEQASKGIFQEKTTSQPAAATTATEVVEPPETAAKQPEPPRMKFQYRLILPDEEEEEGGAGMPKGFAVSPPPPSIGPFVEPPPPPSVATPPPESVSPAQVPVVAATRSPLMQPFAPPPPPPISTTTSTTTASTTPTLPDAPLGEVPKVRQPVSPSHRERSHSQLKSGERHPSPANTAATVRPQKPSAPLPQIAPMTGPRLEGSAGRRGEYIIGAFLGGGACGKVYECVNRESGELLAVKQIVFNPKDPNLKQRLKHLQVELEVLALAVKKNETSIVRFQGAEKRGHTALMYLEYACHGSLLDYIENRINNGSPRDERWQLSRPRSIGSSSTTTTTTTRTIEGDAAYSWRNAALQDAATQDPSSADHTEPNTEPTTEPNSESAATSQHTEVPYCPGKGGNPGLTVDVSMSLGDRTPPLSSPGSTSSRLDGRRSGPPLSVLEAVRIVKQVLRGLAFMHENGYVHLDVKTANVLIVENGDAKLNDFGCALRIDSSNEGAGTSGNGDAEKAAKNVSDDASQTPSSGSKEHATTSSAADANEVSSPPHPLKRKRSEEDVRSAATESSSSATAATAAAGSVPTQSTASNDAAEGTGAKSDARKPPATRDGSTVHPVGREDGSDSASKDADGSSSSASQHPETANGAVPPPAASQHRYAVLAEVTELQGTALYMAPEMIRFEREYIGTPGDVWSVGCLAMEVLTGDAPWSHIAHDKMMVLFRIGSAREALKLPIELIERSMIARRWVHENLPKGLGKSGEEGPEAHDARSSNKSVPGMLTSDEQSAKDEQSSYGIGAAGGGVDVESNPYSPTNSEAPMDFAELSATRYCEAHMVDFLQCCLRVAPGSRWTARQLLNHPFVRDIS